MKLLMKLLAKKYFLIFSAVSFSIVSCTNNVEKPKNTTLTTREVENTTDFDTAPPLNQQATFEKLATTPNHVVLTGIAGIRLIPIYKLHPKADRNVSHQIGGSYQELYEEAGENSFHYFMPAIDVVYGYNMINVGHYDLGAEKMSYFFQKPVLVRTLYFPSAEKDSLRGKLITRDFFFVSVYEEDTNKDSLINNQDMRYFYYINATNTVKQQLLPKGFSAVKSDYDYKEDIMYIYARKDVNNNGSPEKTEPMHIFWLRLSQPAILKQLL